MVQPIKLYGHAMGPNPWKVYILLEELGIPYTQELMDMKVLHQQPYEGVNPNGRVPAINDPNTGITIWESGAILEYLVSEYDKEGKLSYKTSPEKYLTQQYLHFQVSGQGPYFGQAAWFGNFHPEKVPSAVERYQKEISRVTGVLESILKQNPKNVLVGDHITYADIAFIPWYWLVEADFLETSGKLREQIHNDNPHWSKWIKDLNARPAAKKAFDERLAEIKKAHGG